MLMNAIIVGLVMALTKFFAWFATAGLERPIFCVPILGALLGHPMEGLIMGAELELIFIGNVSLGGVMPSDFTVGALFGAAFAMLLGADLSAAITLALPLAALGTLLYSGMKVVVTSLAPKFDELLEKHNIKAFKRLWICQMIGYNLCYFLLGFLCILAGTDAVGMLVAAIPDWLQKSMNVASTMLPALGMALLLKSLWTKSDAPWYFLGFGMGAFLIYNGVTGAELVDGAVKLSSSPSKILSLVTIAFIGAAIAALVIFKELEKKKQTNVTVNAVVDESEDFFND